MAIAAQIAADQATLSLIERGERLGGSTFERLCALYGLGATGMRRRMIAWCHTVGVVPGKRRYRLVARERLP
jgi:hypothetical protein